MRSECGARAARRARAHPPPPPSRRGASAATAYVAEAFGVTHAPGAAGELARWAAAAPAAADDVEASDAFAKFLASATAKGFFKGAEEGAAHAARREKLVATFRAKVLKEAGGAAAPAPAPAPAAGDEAAAEAAKAAGNAAVAAGQHHRAVEHYSEALELAPASANRHVFFANRAAAQQALKNFAAAADDARAAVAAEPTYAKGWSRLGAALAALDDAPGAVAAYEECVARDPANKAAAAALADAKRAADGARKVAARGGGGGGGGAPNPLAGMMPPGFAMPPGMEALASDPDIRAAISDPELAPVVASMMRDGPMSIMQHMGNPKVRCVRLSARPAAATLTP